MYTSEKKQAYVSGQVGAEAEYHINIKTRRLFFEKMLYERSKYYYPLNVSLIYCHETMFDNLGVCTGLDSGWKLNVQQYLKEDSNKVFYYDGKGLQHEFVLAENSTTEWFDCAGSGLTLWKNNLEISIEDSAKTKYIFTKGSGNIWFLNRIQNIYGHALTFVYENDLLTEICGGGITDRFVYEDGKLISIKTNVKVHQSENGRFSSNDLVYLGEESARCLSDCKYDSETDSVNFSYLEDENSNNAGKLRAVSRNPAESITFTYNDENSLIQVDSSFGQRVVFSKGETVVQEQVVKDNVVETIQEYTIEVNNEYSYLVTNIKGVEMVYRYDSSEDPNFLYSYEKTAENEAKDFWRIEKDLKYNFEYLQKESELGIENIEKTNSVTITNKDPGSYANKDYNLNYKSFEIRGQRFLISCLVKFQFEQITEKRTRFNGGFITATINNCLPEQKILKFDCPVNPQDLRKHAVETEWMPYSAIFTVPNGTLNEIILNFTIDTSFCTVQIKDISFYAVDAVSSWQIEESAPSANKRFAVEKVPVTCTLSNNEKASYTVTLTDSDWMQNLKNAATATEESDLWTFVANDGKKRIANVKDVNISTDSSEEVSFNSIKNNLCYKKERDKLVVCQQYTYDNEGRLSVNAWQSYAGNLITESESQYDAFSQLISSNSTVKNYDAEWNLLSTHTSSECTEYNEQGLPISKSQTQYEKTTKTDYSYEETDTGYTVIESSYIGNHLVKTKRTYDKNTGKLYHFSHGANHQPDPQKYAYQPPVFYKYDAANAFAGVRRMESNVVQNTHVSNVNGMVESMRGDSPWYYLFTYDNYGNLLSLREKPNIADTDSTSGQNIIECSTTLNSGSAVDVHVQNFIREIQTANAAISWDSFKYSYDKHGRLVELSVTPTEKSEPKSDTKITFIYSDESLAASQTQYKLDQSSKALLRKVIDNFAGRVYTYHYKGTDTLFARDTYALKNGNCGDLIVSEYLISSQNGTPLYSEFSVVPTESTSPEYVLTETVNEQEQSVTHQLHQANELTYPTEVRKTTAYQQTQSQWQPQTATPLYVQRTILQEEIECLDATYTDDEGKSIPAIDWETTSTTLATLKTEYTYQQTETGVSVPLITQERVLVGETQASQTAYTYNAQGMLTSAGNRTYEYDSQNRLVKETVGTTSTTYAYDANGNITAKTTNGQTQTYTYGNFNRLTSYNGTGIAYDVAGNPLNWVNGITEMTFSRHNLLTNVTANGTEITYDYDGYGKRIRKTVYGDTQEFYYCGDKLVARKDTIYPLGIGEETQYKYWYFLYDNTGVYGMVYDGETYLYSKNILGDITGLYQYIDGVGLIPQAVYEYDAWGACTVKTAFGNIDMDSFSIGNLNPFRYRGYYYDVETGLAMVGQRYYSPELCRFIQPADVSSLNPSSLNGLNLYSYANNNPISIAYSGFGFSGSAGGGMVSSIGSSVGGGAISGSGGGGSSSPSRNLPSVPGWLGTLSTGLDHGFTMINPIRSAIACLQFTDLWDLMRLDGVTELPGALSKVATGIGWGLSIAGGVIAGYEKYASGASLSSSIAGGLINAGISIGGMYASTAIATAAMGALAASSLAIPGGVIIVGGAVIAVAAGIAINHLFTKLEIGGNTIEGHLNDFVDWLIFWD